MDGRWDDIWMNSWFQAHLTTTDGVSVLYRTELYNINCGEFTILLDYCGVEST